jgi:hypothetical protein
MVSLYKGIIVYLYDYNIITPRINYKAVCLTTIWKWRLNLLSLLSNRIINGSFSLHAMSQTVKLHMAIWTLLTHRRARVYNIIINIYKYSNETYMFNIYYIKSCERAVCAVSWGNAEVVVVHGIASIIVYHVFNIVIVLYLYRCTVLMISLHGHINTDYRLADTYLCICIGI